MNAIEDREKALEQIYFLNSEIAFKVRSRRDRLLAVWICGMTGTADAEAYAGEIFDVRMAGADDEGVIAKILADLRSAGKNLDERALRERMEALSVAAMQDLVRQPPL
ncbi:DUF1476 domain-containing protein [Rhizobium lentis]|uniref:ATPase inhibitor subunit zeta n=1 Tax=Rhizobium lentis TaxID=1138194 RepID=UPI001C82C696|nr:ATPase inhibitor subunit zeta [Rhizobium lentis]MBX5131939.1 DUF1476 domain-containing protein [Rhizobium lentis]MBX5155525.1 DUF1476 domain-containing protein [Rhizobium lentis]